MRLLKYLKSKQLLGIINREPGRRIVLNVPSKFSLVYNGMENDLTLITSNTHKKIMKEHIINYEKADNLTNVIERTLASEGFMVSLDSIIKFSREVCGDRSEGICYGSLHMSKLDSIINNTIKGYYYYVDDFYFWVDKTGGVCYGYEDLQLGEVNSDKLSYNIQSILYESNIDDFDPEIIATFLKINGKKL